MGTVYQKILRETIQDRPMKMKTINITRKKFNLPLLDKDEKKLVYVPSTIVELDNDFKLYRYKNKLYLENGVMVFDFTVDGKVTKQTIEKRLSLFKNPESFWYTVNAAINNRTAEERLSHYLKYSDRTEQDKILTVLGVVGDVVTAKFYDGLAYIRGEYKFDIIKVDDFLKRKYPEEYPDDISMKDFMTKKWGREFAAKFIDYV